jgi:hypothetical protein
LQSKPQKEIQIPNPKCNQQQTNHYITEITPYKSNPKSKSTVKCWEMKSIRREGGREMSKRREIFGIEDGGRTLKSGVGEGREVMRRRSSGSRAIRLVIR